MGKFDMGKLEAGKFDAGKFGAGKFEAGMDSGDRSHDDCPNCRQRYEILLVRFALAGVHMITACPNCAMVHGDRRDTKRWSDKWRKRARLPTSLRRV
jgi:hypothetical protein